MREEQRFSLGLSVLMGLVLKSAGARIRVLVSLTAGHRFLFGAATALSFQSGSHCGWLGGPDGDRGAQNDGFAR